MKAPKHLLNAMEMTTCRNGVEIYTRHNAKWLYIIQRSNLLTELFTFYNPGPYQLKNGITLS